MQTHEDILRNLSILENENRECFFVYLKIIALPAAVYLYFLLGYFNIFKFQVGFHSVVLIGIIFLVSLVFARHNAEFGSCYFKQKSEDFRIELKKYIVKNLMKIGPFTKSNASFDDFIDEFSKNIRNSNYASVAAGIFPTMGILGTFISIAMTMPDFSSQTSDALEKEISLLLTGVGTAFYVSIYGILLSLWWIFFEKRGLNKFNIALEGIKEETKGLFWTKEEIEQAYLKENLLHFEKIGSMFERLSSNDFFERLGRSIEDKFELFDKMLTLEAKATNEGALFLKESMQALEASQEKQLNLGNLHGEILNALNAFNEKLPFLHENILKDRESFLSSCTEILNKIEIDSQISKNSINEMILKFKEITNESNRKLIEFLELKIATKESPDVTALRESLEQIDAETEQIIQKLESLRQ
ncbi:MAG: MotA/TolQ/ExbB proton channel family protein [Sulfurospirillaceae bacterium]|jgi:hypothetical protein|nr:MotA/TolQ/ExbB proton channel family protein [Sulfurospirillaceae bacterium]MCK9546738.1 MotA/TolQ/ExbB proton channel family protein [Sulfurospirillaceae bacterium]